MKLILIVISSRYSNLAEENTEIMDNLSTVVIHSQSLSVFCLNIIQ